MSEELLSNDRRVEKHLTPPVFEQLTSLFITICTADCDLAITVAMLQQTLYQQQASLRSESIRDHSKMKNESVKKSSENSKIFQKKNAKWSSNKIAQKKTNTFTIIAMNFVQEQLKTKKITYVKTVILLLHRLFFSFLIAPERSSQQLLSTCWSFSMQFFA